MGPSESTASTEVAYDDGPWSADEGLLLAARAGSAIGWSDMDQYDNYPEPPAQSEPKSHA